MSTLLDRCLDRLDGKSKLVSITTRTRPKLLVKSRMTGALCPWPDGIEKLTRRRAFIGCDYESCVDRQRDREGGPCGPDGKVEPFNAVALWGGAGEHDGPYTVRHKTSGKRYLFFLPMLKGGEALIDQEKWVDVATGKEIERAEAAAFLPEFHPNLRQGTQRPVLWRTVEVGNVEQLVCGNVVYNRRRGAA